MLLKVLKFLLISKNSCVSGFSVLPALNRENKTQWSNDTCAILCCLVFASRDYLELSTTVTVGRSLVRGIWIQYGIVLGQDSFGERWDANVVVCATPRTTYCRYYVNKLMWNRFENWVRTVPPFFLAVT